MKRWIGRIATIPVRHPDRHASAFSRLRAVREAGLEAEDGVRRVEVPWASIWRISAAMGRQTYDMTRILTVDHSVGQAIFLPEVEPLWTPLLEAAAQHLAGMVPLAEWSARLASAPDSVAHVYHRCRGGQQWPP
jgi:hypothetical protein